jgi:hypothetical protein
VIAFKRLVGWLSWLVVATQLYDLACSNLDDSSYFVLPTAMYQWMDELVGPTTDEASFDLAVWSTSTSMVLGMHMLAWAILAGARFADHQRGASWPRWQQKLFPVMGWSSWLLVSTITFLLIIAEIVRSRGGRLPSDAMSMILEVIGGLLLVGSAHLAVLKFMRRQRS